MAGLIPILIFIGLLVLIFWMTRQGCNFNQRILVSLILGLGFGFILQLATGGPASMEVGVTNQAFKLVGMGYLSLLEMLVIPLILTSIVHAIVNLGGVSGRMLNRLALFSVCMLLMLTAIASAIGAGVGLLFHVGKGLQLPVGQFLPEHSYSGLVPTLLAMFPSNPIQVMDNQNTVAIVIFAILLGVATLMLSRVNEEQAHSFKAFVSSAFFVVKKLASVVVSLTPYGVLALMASMASTQGFASLLGLADFMVAMFVAMAVVILLHLIIVSLCGQNPWAYLKLVYPALLVAFTTRSSFATLPVTEEMLRERLGLRQVTSTFVPSMGATIGMNACAGVFPAMLVVMALTIAHEPLTWGILLMVMFINAIASLGISGIPGTAFVAATVSLTTLGLPYAVVGLVQGIDPIIDMGRTATNVNGVMTTAVLVDKTLLDES